MKQGLVVSDKNYNNSGTVLKSSEKKIKQNIYQILAYRNEDCSYKIDNLSKSIKESIFEEELLKLQKILDDNNPDKIIEMLFEMEYQFKNFSASEEDLLIFKEIMVNYFINWYWNLLFNKYKILQYNSLMNYFYIYSCSLDVCLNIMAEKLIQNI